MPFEALVSGDGVECRAVYEEGGSPAVLFLHGYSFRYTVWLDSGSVEVPSSLGLAWAAPDMPYGRSTTCTSRTGSVEVNVAVALSAARLSGARELVVVGASMGGRYALYIAHAAPVRALVLVAPALGRDEKAWTLARRVRGPVLIIWGTRDRVVRRKEVEELVRIIPGARLVVLDGAGHVIHLERPEEFNSLLKEFLESTLRYQHG